MEVFFTKSFYREIGKVRDKKLAAKIEEVIIKVKNAKQFSEIENLKKLTGFKNAYRIRIGDYRIGILYEKNAVTFSVFGNRKDIYKFFP